MKKETWIEGLKENLQTQASEYMKWLTSLKDEDILGYFMNEEALKDGMARSDAMILLEHFWVVGRLLQRQSISGSGELLCKECFARKWGEPKLSAGHGIPIAGLKDAEMGFYCDRCHKKLN